MATLQDLITFIDERDINLLNILFISWILIIIVFGGLMRFIEPRLPTSIRQTFRYGRHSLQGVQDPLVSKLEVPKSWFGHFYRFALVWSTVALFLMLKSLAFKTTAPEFVLTFLDFFAGGPSHRKVEVSSTCGLVAIVLMTVQCFRRFYETNFLQIFSSKGKINLSHYIVGYLHYFGAITAILANTEGFVRGTKPTTFAFSNISLLQYMCIFIFYTSWTQQYNSNMILINLRKNKNGQVVTEGHLLPTGGFFEFISSPHMFFEVAMYLSMFGCLFYSKTWHYVAIWVFLNQTLNAWLTHQWYLENFKNYPKERHAIFPYVL